MNILQFLNKSDTINTKANIIYNKVSSDYNNKLIKTKVEQYYILWNSLKELYDNVGKPMLVLRKAKSTPLSDDYNNMMNEAKNDLKFLYTDCMNLDDALENSYSDIQTTRSIYNNEVNYIQYRLKDLKQKVDEISSSIITFSDNFIDNTNFDSSAVDGPTALVNKENNILTLPAYSFGNFNKNTLIDIMKGSNGFPGNTHATTVINGQNYFEGEENLHIDLSEITDSNDDTWFEYELYNVDHNTYTKCNGYGFKYKEGLSWINDKPLTLMLNLRNTTPSICSYINIKPYIVNDNGYVPCILKKIRIYNGNDNVIELSINQIFNDTKSFMFQPMNVTNIVLELVQNSSYRNKIGHFYYIDLAASNNTFMNNYNNEYRRINGDNPSVELLGMKYDPNTKNLTNEKNYTNSSISKVIDSYSIKKQLFTLNEDNLECNFEILNGNRKCIGIRSFNIGNATYTQIGTYISKNFTCNNIIQSIALESNEYIPNEFGVGEWIKYEISIDDGAKWFPIVPKHKAYMPLSSVSIDKPFYKYEVNSDTPRELRSGITGYIDTPFDINTVRLRITLTKPEDKDKK